MKAKMHNYTTKQIDYIKEHVVGRSRKELTEMFNEHFGLCLTEDQIKGAVTRNGLKSGLSGRFQKGQKAWNAGMKGLDFGGRETRFKKGQTPLNHRPVGSERLNVDGYYERKIAEPNKWALKHRLVWEEAHGPIPEKHVVIFGDGNRQNLDLNNLILISRKQLVTMNKNNLIQNDIELTKMGIVIADIYQKINERKKR